MDLQNHWQKNFGPSNIRVNSIAPGVIDTDMNSNIDVAIKKQIEPQVNHLIENIVKLQELIHLEVAKVETTISSVPLKSQALNPFFDNSSRSFL